MSTIYSSLLSDQGFALFVGILLFLITLFLASRKIIGFTFALLFMLIALGASLAIAYRSELIDYFSGKSAEESGELPSPSLSKGEAEPELPAATPGAIPAAASEGKASEAPREPLPSRAPFEGEAASDKRKPPTQREEKKRASSSGSNPYGGQFDRKRERVDQFLEEQLEGE